MRKAECKLQPAGNEIPRAHVFKQEFERHRGWFGNVTMQYPYSTVITSLLMPMGEDKHGQCIGTDKVKLVLPVVQDDFMCGDLSFF